MVWSNSAFSPICIPFHNWKIATGRSKRGPTILIWILMLIAQATATKKTNNLRKFFNWKMKSNIHKMVISTTARKIATIINLIKIMRCTR